MMAANQEPSALSAVIGETSDGEPATSESETRSQVVSEQAAMELSNGAESNCKSDSITDQTPLKPGSANKGFPKRLVSYTVQKFRRNHYYVLHLALCTLALTTYTIFIYNEYSNHETTSTVRQHCYFDNHYFGTSSSDSVD
jgi:hypothetical protein